MYNAWWCPYCRQVRAILARNHIRYSILDATSPRVQAIMVRRFGDTAVPRTVIGGVVVEGVDVDFLKPGDFGPFRAGGRQLHRHALGYHRRELPVEYRFRARRLRRQAVYDL